MRGILRFFSFLVRTSQEVRISRRSLALVVAAGVVSGFGGAGLLILINRTLADPEGSRTAYAGAFAALCLIVPCTGLLSQWLTFRLGSTAIFELRLQLCRHILASPVRQLEEVGAPRLLASFTDDIGAITSALIDLPMLSMHGAILLGTLVYLAWLSPSIFLLVLACLVVGILGCKLPMGRAVRYFRLLRDEWDALLGHFRGLTLGIKELKLHRERREAFVTEVYRPTGEAIRTYGIRGQTIMAASNNAAQVLFFVIVGVLLYILPGFRQVDTNLLTAYVVTLLFMRAPLGILLARLPDMSRAAVAAEKLTELRRSLDSRNPEREMPAAAALPAAWQRLELAGVTHSYRREQEDDDFALGPIDLTFEPGELVFVIGGNGSGKTTLAKLLVGLYRPEAGEIRLDGTAVTDETRDRYRQLFSAVFYDFHLFENLLGLSGPDLEARAREYLVELRLDRKVRIEEGGLSTLDLSQGQRKRLALLTAYLEDRPIYLFDEWASDQDPLFKEIFYGHLLSDLKARGKTVIVITHDDRYHHLADRIVRLEYGQLEYDRRLPDPAPALQSLKGALS